MTAYIDLVTPTIWLITRGTNEIKNHQLEVATARTGSVHYRAIRTGTIRGAVERIASELHAVCLELYAVVRADCGFHQTRVTVERPELLCERVLGIL